ncbi:unnamed protein product [Didymodactylos carnosus]|uniref:Uncharacterized protein n=1 Tax=Didymodactylos carnosus TaxID=1234261 RepID=A0A813XTQ3_9BILA|nr:unnamed protein product [Didymodactylos carnosus]CAF0872891.1 unnamed protein product [Didymodactylos carnosus]CAF3653535.1 unnamed protein product [Didymodactylos carnosus]CAF3660093.1 unnamed protein product [Didymodactylos carnosus]
MLQQKLENNNLPVNYLQFHENAFVSPLNLINLSQPPPSTFGKAPHTFYETRLSPYDGPQRPLTLQSVDAEKLNMLTFLARRKLKEDRWKKKENDMIGGNDGSTIKNRRSNLQQQRRSSSTRSTSATNIPKKSILPKKNASDINSFKIINRSETPSSVSFSVPSRIDTTPTLSISDIYESKQREIIELHKKLVSFLNVLHNDPPQRENIIDETEQEKQRRIRLKRERIRRDLRATYNSHTELKQILIEMKQPEANLHRLIYRHVNAYKTALLTVETLTNEAPIKSNDSSAQKLMMSFLSMLETLLIVNKAFHLSSLNIDPEYLQPPPVRKSIINKNFQQPKQFESKSTKSRGFIVNNEQDDSSNLLPSIYHELVKKKNRNERPRSALTNHHSVPSVLYGDRQRLRPLSADSIRQRLPEVSKKKQQNFARSTISIENKINRRARSHSPLPSHISPTSPPRSTGYSQNDIVTIDHILMKIAPRLLTTYTGQELSEQIEKARVIIPMFLTDEYLSENEIVRRVTEMLIPRNRQRIQPSPPLTHYQVQQTLDNHSQSSDIAIFQQQIVEWEDEMNKIRRRVQNVKNMELEDPIKSSSKQSRTVTFNLEPQSTPEQIYHDDNVQIHPPLFEQASNDTMEKHRLSPLSNHSRPTAFERSHKMKRLRPLDKEKINRIEEYQKQYQNYLSRTDSTKTDDFDPCKVTERLSELFLDDALWTIVYELEHLNEEICDKMTQNEILGNDIDKEQVKELISFKRLDDYHVEQQQQQVKKRISPNEYDRHYSPVENQYNMSSFEDDFNSESKLSRSDDEYEKDRRETKPKMEGTGRFTTMQTRHSTSSSSSRSSTPSYNIKPAIILRPTTIATSKTTYSSNSQRQEQTIIKKSSGRSSTPSLSSDRDSPKPHQGKKRISQHSGDDNIHVSEITGERVYSLDFDEVGAGGSEMGADTMKISARSLTTFDHDSEISD